MITKLRQAATWLREGLAALRADLADTFSDTPGKLRGAWAWFCFREVTR
jgi:hypothetical protein